MKSIYLTMILAAMAVVAGCSSYEPQSATLEQDAYSRVEGLGDLASDEEMFATAFAPGSQPKNRKDYSLRGYQVTGQPVIDGETASVDVKIFGGVYDSASGDRQTRASSGISETRQTWTLRLFGDTWKIQDAPLG